MPPASTAHLIADDTAEGISPANPVAGAGSHPAQGLHLVKPQLPAAQAVAASSAPASARKPGAAAPQAVLSLEELAARIDRKALLCRILTETPLTFHEERYLVRLLGTPRR